MEWKSKTTLHVELVMGCPMTALVALNQLAILQFSHCISNATSAGDKIRQLLDKAILVDLMQLGSVLALTSQSVTKLAKMKSWLANYFYYCILRPRDVEYAGVRRCPRLVIWDPNPTQLTVIICLWLHEI